jgi:hypothetical protein
MSLISLTLLRQVRLIKALALAPAPQRLAIMPLLMILGCFAPRLIKWKMI